MYSGKMAVFRQKYMYSTKSGCIRTKKWLYSDKSSCIRAKWLYLVSRLVWLFAINRTTIPRIYSCSELVCAIVDLGIVGLSVMCAHCGHSLFIYLCKT